MEILKNMERLPIEAGRKLKPYMEALLKIHGENVVSIYIYGSAATGDYIPAISDINSVVVLKTLRFGQLKDSLQIVDKGIRKKIPAPLFFTPEHIRTSLDTFPLEFLEMKESHILLYGDDLLGALKIDHSHIRFVCEEQLKGKLIRIRQAYLEIGLRKKGMEALIKESLNSLFPIFKGLLRLKGITPPSKKEDIAQLLAETFKVDADTFIAVLRDEKNDEKISGEKLETFLARYIEQIDKLADVADRL